MLSLITFFAIDHTKLKIFSQAEILGWPQGDPEWKHVPPNKSFNEVWKRKPHPFQPNLRSNMYFFCSQFIRRKAKYITLTQGSTQRHNLRSPHCFWPPISNTFPHIKYINSQVFLNTNMSLSLKALILFQSSPTTVMRPGIFLLHSK